jgi:hypothetical protein
VFKINDVAQPSQSDIKNSGKPPFMGVFCCPGGRQSSPGVVGSETHEDRGFPKDSFLRRLFAAFTGHPDCNYRAFHPVSGRFSR